MTSRCGLDPVESAVLNAAAKLCIETGRQRVKSTLVLDHVFSKAGFAHADSYRRALDLARPWTTELPLVDFYGNRGMQGGSFPAADPRYTEIGLTEAGRACVEGATMPLGLAFGNVYKGGPTPSFDIRSVIAAVRAVLMFEPPQTVRDLLGTPSSPTGAQVQVDIASLHSGARTPIALRASITEEDIPELKGRGLVIANLPAQVAVDDVASRLVDRVQSAEDLEWIARIDDFSQLDNQRLCVSAHPGSDASIDDLYAVWGIEIFEQIQLPLPAEQYVAAWAQAHASADVEAGLQRLESLIA